MASTQIKDKNGTVKDIHDRRLPSSLGTAGQNLQMNSSGTGIEWSDDVSSLKEELAALGLSVVDGKLSVTYAAS